MLCGLGLGCCRGASIYLCFTGEADRTYRKTGKPELAQDCYDRLQEAEDNEEFLAMYAEAVGDNEKQ